MNILVCVRIGPDGEISPFDACAYELALSQKNAEVTLLSMGAASVKGALENLTRLGAARAYLLCDSAFAGADTLATGYSLSRAAKILKPDLVFCGRQTLVGDTGQTAVIMAQKSGYNLITNVMGINEISDEAIICTTRDEGTARAAFPALITVERINTLRLPSIRSKAGEVLVLSAADIKADLSKCGLTGSPTRVIESHENRSGKRKCKFIGFSELDGTIKTALLSERQAIPVIKSDQKLGKVLCVSEAPATYARGVSDNVIILPRCDTQSVIAAIETEKPDAVLFSSDSVSKRVSALVAAKLDLGLCADCTALDTDGNVLFMIRPALSGSVIAKIKSNTVPAMATVRTKANSSDIIVTAGFGVRNNIKKVREFAKSINATLGATRKAVDNGYLPYEAQVGLTGRTVAPPVYIAIGVSGAVHHIVGMDKSGTVIAINPDKDAPIFEYADYGIIAEF